MGSPSGLAAVAVAVLVVSLLVAHGACFPDVLPGPNIPTEYTSPYVPPGPNISARYTGEWLDAKATWYGKPTGAGPDDNGGACGFKEVNLPPFNSLSSCGNLPLFKDGKGCGSCFEVKCEKPEACSGQPVTVVITDMNYDPLAPYHFDLSGMGFGAMAKPGREDELRHAGMIDMQFRRVKCRYQGLTVTFHVEEGSNPFYFAVLVKYVANDGNVVQVDLKEKANGQWQTLWESWGAIWRLDADHPLEGPFSLRITSESGKQLVAKDVIPKDWKPKTVYPSKVQLD